MGTHIRGKNRWDFRGEQRVSLIGDLSGRTQQAGLVLHLHRDDSLPLFVIVLQKAHERGKSFRVGLHGICAEIRQSGIGHLHGDRRRNLPSSFVFPLYDLCPRKTPQILLDPGGSVQALSILPTAKPEKHDLHGSFTGLINERLRNGEIERSFLRLNHFPSYGQKQRIHAKMIGNFPDVLHISGRRRIGIVHLSGQENERLVLHHQHQVAVLFCDMRDGMFAHGFLLLVMPNGFLRLIEQRAPC